MVTESTIVTQFATIITGSSRSKPYASHNTTPALNAMYINSDNELVSRVRTTLIACGKKELVVKQAAAYPINSAYSIYYILLLGLE
jgi:hypothetical protein